MAHRPHLIHDIVVGIHALAEYDKSRDEKLELTKDDYSHTETIPVEGQDEMFLMKDYAPKAFHHIRKLCGITQESYLNSWQLPKDKAKLEQSAGRSGSLFFRTDDKKYFFKTILHPEVGTLMRILEDYIKHLTDTEGKSFIMRLVGLHRISYGSDKVWILVMCNSFPTFITMNEIFDLKGRKPKPGKSFQERGRKTPLHNPQKDNEITRTLNFVKDEERQFFITQLKTDVDFLNNHNLMDYSLLVGIHTLTEEEKNPKPAEAAKPEKEKEKKKKKKKKSKSNAEAATPVCDINMMRAAGGFLGKSPNGEDEIYFIGIIDCLTSYILKKKIAFAFKRILWDPETLSTVKAKFYARRFYDFMTHQLLGIDPNITLAKESKSTAAATNGSASATADKKSKKNDKETKANSDEEPDSISDTSESHSKLANYMRETKSPKPKPKSDEDDSGSEDNAESSSDVKPPPQKTNKTKLESTKKAAEEDGKKASPANTTSKKKGPRPPGSMIEPAKKQAKKESEKSDKSDKSEEKPAKKKETKKKETEADKKTEKKTSKKQTAKESFLTSSESKKESENLGESSTSEKKPTKNKATADKDSSDSGSDSE